MKTSQTIYTFSLALMLVIPGVTPSLAEAPEPAGIVTHVFGTATLQHGPEGEAHPVHFKDKVYIQDIIKTDEESIVRVLMGNKALVTIGEMSLMTITEEVHHATLNIDSGAISLSVARKQMNPGEYIEIRTPHAVAAIRGTKLIAEVANKHSTRVSVIEGHVDTAYHASDPTHQFSMNRQQAFEFFKPEFKKPPRVQKLRGLARKSLEEAKPVFKDHGLQQIDRGPAEEDVAQKHMTKATDLANQLTPKVPVIDGQQQVIASGNSDSSTASSSNASSSPSGQATTLGTPSSGTSESTTSSSSTPAASAPAPAASAPAPAASAPAPVASAPAPVVSAPAPVVSAPPPPAPSPSLNVAEIQKAFLSSNSSPGNDFRRGKSERRERRERRGRDD